MNESLWQDLSLVLPSRREVEPGDAVVTAYVGGKACGLDEAVARCDEMLQGAKHPAITGLNMITMEAARAAMSLAMRCDARVLPDATELALDVAQQATLAHVYASDYVIKPGPDRWAADHPVASAIARRVLHSMFVRPGLDGVLALREAIRAKGAAAITEAIPQTVRRVAVLLPPDTEAQVISQWHKLAADVQSELRVCVMTLPGATYGNGRGALEVVTWRSGFAGAVQFADGVASRCRTGDVGVDVAVELGALHAGDAARRIVFGVERDDSAEVSFVMPGLAMGLAAHVCRFDGQMLRLCNDMTVSPPDPVVAVLERMAGGA